ncbi:MAG: flagellar hook capping FlgD N-terminal domain-containing protein [Oscillospiraceae bacterium]
MEDNLAIDSANGAVTLKYYSTKVDTDADADSASYLDFDGYLKLMVAQMSNQDFNDPMSDSEFIQQMASYSMMEAISQMTEQTQISYAASLVGKAVTVNDGSNFDTGVVESVIISDGKYQLLVNGTKYDSDKVTDIVDTNTYNTISKVIGMNGTVKDSELGEYTGKITNIIVKGGEGYAVINNRLYAFSEISNISPDTSSDDSDETDTDNTVTEGNTDNTAADGGAGSTVTDDTSAQTEAAANSGAVSYASVADSQASMFLAEDGYDYNNALNDYANEKLAQYYNAIENDEELAEEYYFEGAKDEEEDESFTEVLGGYLSPMERAQAAQRSAVLGSDGYYTTEVEDVSSMLSGVNDHSDEKGFTVRDSSAMSSADDEDDEELLIEEEDIDLSSIAASGTDTESGQITSYMTSSKNPDRGLTEIYEGPGVDLGVTVGSNSAYTQWPTEYRAFQNKYPAEAALANELGTKMCDIRFIHNTDINSVINTDTVLGCTVSGKRFTDIGFSGKGKLGEVVTWADGSQRVEIISSSGSTWYTTTGNYTLDEICDFSTNFNIADKLTIFEKVIRAAAKEYTAEEQAILDSYSNAWAQHAYYNSDTLL